MKLNVKNLIMGMSLLSTIVMVSPAYAWRNGVHGYSGWRGAGWGVGAGLLAGTIIGSQLSHPYYYPRPHYVYIPQPVYVQEQPQVIVQEPSVYTVNPETGALSSAPRSNSARQIWYFCTSSNTYYPYVKNCPEGWREVPATPPTTN